MTAKSIYLYQRADKEPAVPQQQLTYRFDDDAIIGDLEGWSRHIPASDGRPLFITSTVVVGTDEDVILREEWRPPSLYVNDTYTGATEGTPLLGEAASLSQFVHVGIKDGFQGGANVDARINPSNVALVLRNLDDDTSRIVFNGGVSFESACPFDKLCELIGAPVTDPNAAEE